MAGDWLKLELSIHEKPEVAAMSEHLDMDTFAVVGRLHRIWAWFSAQTKDGHAPNVTPAFLDRLVAHEGFAAAMTAVGWLVQRNGSLSVPNFDRHMSKSAKTRALARDRQSRSRHAPRATKAQPEKRREEKRKTNPVDAGASTPRDGFHAGKPRDEIWDAVCAEWGMNPVTSAEKSRVGKLVRDLRAKGATPGEITARRRRYAKKWPNAADTPEAIVKHWDAFPGKATRPDAHHTQIVIEQKQRDAEEAAALASVKAMNEALDALSEAELEALRTKAIARAPNAITREALERATFKARTLRLAMFNVLNED